MRNENRGAAPLNDVAHAQLCAAKEFSPAPIPSKAERFFDRYVAEDEDALLDAIDEAVAVYIDGKFSSRRDDLGDAIVAYGVINLQFSDCSRLEVFRLARDGVFVGCSPKDFEIVE